jgi:hypothetical protein
MKVLYVTILDWWVDPEVTTKFAHGAQQEAITVAARLTSLKLNKVIWSYTYIVNVRWLVLLTFQPDIVLVGFLEI